ncbi:hypothetical protein VDGL01_00020 [Verticillium dahliae]
MLKSEVDSHGATFLASTVDPYSYSKSGVRHLDTHARPDDNLVELLAPLDWLRIVEDLLKLLQRPAHRLHGHEPHEQPVYHVQRQQNRVHPPANVLETRRDGIEVDEAEQPGDQVVGRQPLAPNVRAQHLGRVQRLQRRPAKRRHDAVEEHHADEGVPGRPLNVAVGEAREHVDGHVDEARQEHASQQQRPPAHPVDEEGADDAAAERKDRVEAVHQQLLPRRPTAVLSRKLLA